MPEHQPSSPRHHRPALKGEHFFDSIESGVDPARVTEAADQAAHVLVRGARASDDPQVAQRVLRLAEDEGLETIAEVWSGAAPDSLAGCLWRLFLLRSWVHADPVQVAREFEAGRAHASVARVVAGVADPPGPDEMRAMVDQVLRGITAGDFADVLFRAAAFARVVAFGRAQGHGDQVPTTESARRMLVLSEQLEHAAHEELTHGLI